MNACRTLRRRAIMVSMAVTYGHSDTAYPYAVARYTCRCGDSETQHGPRRLGLLPRGWQALMGAGGSARHVCPACAERATAKRS